MGHKGLRLSDDDAAALAVSYVAQLDLRGWRYELGAVTRNPTGMIGVAFDTYSPAGTLVDGPAVYLVDPLTGRVMALSDWLTTERR